ncbi:hypothetical protein BCV70DRAFT_199479 [Testicularia cyperi]|uniref:BTB domain-containing protein n=1 Tax=Testicularia cyperi TaxID=1882483 RepID=A0A317XUW3_9BASI|nr:hypothetical protein BCV70DRAFT_199479 [Testicularia cyperi]
MHLEHANGSIDWPDLPSPGGWDSEATVRDIVQDLPAHAQTRYCATVSGDLDPLIEDWKVVSVEGIEMPCSSLVLFQQSPKLFHEFAACCDGQIQPGDHLSQRIETQHSQHQLDLLLQTCTFQYQDTIKWEGYNLDELTDAVRLFQHYEIRRWSIIALENEIIDRIWDEGKSQCGRFQFSDLECVSRLASLARETGMCHLERVLALRQPSLSGHVLDPADDRPCKRRRIAI